MKISSSYIFYIIFILLLLFHSAHLTTTVWFEPFAWKAALFQFFKWRYIVIVGWRIPFSFASDWIDKSLSLNEVILIHKILRCLVLKFKLNQSIVIVRRLLPLPHGNPSLQINMLVFLWRIWFSFLLLQFKGFQSLAKEAHVFDLILFFLFAWWSTRASLSHHQMLIYPSIAIFILSFLEHFLIILLIIIVISIHMMSCSNSAQSHDIFIFSPNLVSLLQSDLIYLLYHLLIGIFDFFFWFEALDESSEIALVLRVSEQLLGIACYHVVVYLFAGLFG